MMCNRGHYSEVMWRISNDKGFLHGCKVCGYRFQEAHSPGNYNLRDYISGQCYMCSNMDMTESQDLKEHYIPGRCRCKGYRIIDDEMPTWPCENFVFRHGKNWRDEKWMSIALREKARLF
jgi:hypothetical protein